MKNNMNEIFFKKYSEEIISIKELEKPIEVINTGNINFNKVLECGGIPKSRITEIFGNESSGKTTIALQIAKQSTIKNNKVLYIDMECTLNINYVKENGINPNLITICRPKNGEKAFAMIEDALKDNTYELIILDSVAAMCCESELDESIEETSKIGLHARLMSRGLRKIQNPLSKSNTALIFINQLREKIGIIYGNPETTTGGKALKFFSSIRIEVKKIDLIKNGQDKVGIKSKITIVKNKLGKPFETCSVNIYFNEGYDDTMDMIDYAITHNIITKSGTWYYYNDQKICQGIHKLKAYSIENPDWFNDIKSIISNQLVISDN